MVRETEITTKKKKNKTDTKTVVLYCLTLQQGKQNEEKKTEKQRIAQKAEGKKGTRFDATISALGYNLHTL